MTCKICDGSSCIHNVPIFRGLGDEESEKIRDLIEQKNYKSRDTIFHEGESLDEMVIVRSGRIKLVRYGEDGSEYLLDILYSGDIYGGDEVFSYSKYSETGIALDEVGICVIKSDSLKGVIMNNPQIGFYIIEYLNNKMIDYRDALEIIGTKDTLYRVILFLLERSKKTHSSRISLSQEEIGNSIHLTKETVNRKLSELQKRGWIEMRGKKNIEIIDEFSMRNYGH